ncbi:hypothetical protein GCM10025881_04490 [Pseudolysinimonas kribbensis]|uniref:Choice-of-anchor G family protein n=1 Tax=Pseudolysinimonas kribbensis TaxID=433641 RepID=A0ABQ6K3G3_9MICO|nr:choice-of-anchor G family protein [Pseudolysinimonas kribbensis]GMA93625.1 hypothetical protein GCM10025881_04490 [Pseudolysinimonas kribbensis]
MAAALVLGAIGVVPSEASWADRQYDAATVQSVLCTDPGSGTSTGSGTLLGGTLGSTDLSTIASVRGVSATNDGTTTTPTPSTATSLGSGAYSNPLSVSALSGIDADIGPALQLPLTADAGGLNQYARAASDTTSAGAAGAVSNSGGIAVTQRAPGAAMPRFATVGLGQVVQSALGQNLSSLVTGITDAQLGLGAVASSAQLSGCTAEWRGIYTGLVRQYALAGMDATLTSPAVSSLVTTTDAGLSALSAQLNAIAGNSALLNSLGSSILLALKPALSTLGAGTPTVTLSLTPDFSAVTALLSTPITDSSGLFSISPSAGTITLDLDALMGPAYLTSPKINGLAPNSRLLINGTALTALEAAMTSALTAWVSSVIAAVNAALAAVAVNLDLTAPVSALSVNVGTLFVHTNDLTLAQLLAGSPGVTAGIDKSSGLCSVVIVGATLCALVTTVLGNLTPALLASVGQTIGGTLQTALAPTAATVSTLGANLGTATGTLVSTVGGGLTGLFGATGAIQLWANAQNRPDPAELNAGPEPGWAAGLPAPTANPFGTGRYDVAALRMTIRGSATTGLDLARSSAGSNTVTG